MLLPCLYLSIPLTDICIIDNSSGGFAFGAATEGNVFSCIKIPYTKQFAYIFI